LIRGVTIVALFVGQILREIFHGSLKWTKIWANQ
jgi:hypothetical protein